LRFENIRNYGNINLKRQDNETGPTRCGHTTEAVVIPSVGAYKPPSSLLAKGKLPAEQGLAIHPVVNKRRIGRKLAVIVSDSGIAKRQRVYKPFAFFLFLYAII
jgi:hypothetical protein